MEYVRRNFEPYIREQAILYLEKRFESDVELTSIQVDLPWAAAMALLWHGKVALVTATGDGLVMRHKGRRDVPPMFLLRHFEATIDVQTVFSGAKDVPLVLLEGMEIHVPPQGERPDFTQNADIRTAVRIGRVEIREASLTIHPRDRTRAPLKFQLHEVNLDSVRSGDEMRYDAYLTIPRPQGQIHSTGNFGPWAADEPSDTPLSGDYRFDDADLGVFNGIAGILHSKGSFEGQLGSVIARGEADVPDFRLKMTGHTVPLMTSFEAVVDGTNGNTTLKPVRARLGSTSFTTSGAVIRHEGDTRKSIALDVHMPAGNLSDVLKLAMKDSPLLSGILHLDTTIVIPPLSGTVREKLKLDGRFEVTGGKFLRSTIQDQIDSLSRKGQGKPNNREVDEVVSRMAGEFVLEDQVITFRTLAFAVTGAAINLNGVYDLDADTLDFHGALALDAKISQTQSGWKRWVLKPVDPFFAKNGAGTFVKIKIDGPAKQPKFGRDR